MKLLNGWKTYLGLILLVVVCVLNGGNVLDCAREALMSPTGQAGMALGLTAIGLAHKAEKFLGRRKGNAPLN